MACGMLTEVFPCRTAQGHGTIAHLGKAAFINVKQCLKSLDKQNMY